MHTENTMNGRPVHSVRDIFAVAEAAMLAQPKWEAFPIGLRIQYVKRIKTYMEEHGDEIARLISTEAGVTATEAMAADVLPAILSVGWWCANIKGLMKNEKLSGPSMPFSPKRTVIKKYPLGVVGIITPSVNPLIIPLSQIIPAVLAGNAVLLKCSSRTPVANEALLSCIDAAGLPASVVTFINAAGAVAGDAFIDAGVDKLFFTGAAHAGRYLMKQAAARPIPIVSMLHTNACMIICNDADLHKAAACALYGGFSCGGKSAGGVKRIYVHRDVYEPFVEIIKQAAAKLDFGIGDDFNADMVYAKFNPSANIAIKDAEARGAKLIAGESVAGFAVLMDANNSMAVMREEPQCPVIALMPVDDIGAAATAANELSFGAAASVWTQSNRTAALLADKLKCETIAVNDHLTYALPHVPWGGRGESGIGKIHGEAGLREFVSCRAIVRPAYAAAFARKNFWWYPNSPKVYNALKGSVELGTGGVRGRIEGLIKLLKVLPDVFSGKGK